MLNVISLNGRMVDNPRLNENGKKPSVQFALAVDRPWIGGKKSGCDFFKCVAFGRTAQFICSNFVKGQLVAISGSLRNTSYEIASGEKRYKTEILVNNADFAGGKPVPQYTDTDDSGLPPYGERS
jgi:single-strand DNA-binding protein